MKKTMTQVLMTAIFAVVATTQGFSQNNLGASCGCPNVSARTTVDVIAAGIADTAGNFVASSTIFTCDKIYVAQKKLFVGDGKSLTIRPGTVMKFDTSASVNVATALVISRGGKIFAAGTSSCPIVFTSTLDPMDGTYAVTNQQKWGGIMLLGKAFNNITSATAALYVSPGVALIEGFASSDPRAYFGAAPGAEVADDNSGILQYVSIRHGGATTAPNRELNGLTCGSVGKGTTLDHIEVVCNSDDAVEFFGGTVDIKYVTGWFCDDDGLDYDLGWKGSAQFVHIVKLPTTISGGRGDNGFEMDGDDDQSNNTPMSHPIIYNATVIGNGKNDDEAMEIKERAEGEVYNSIFANYDNGANIHDNGQGGRATDAYENWNAGSLKINNCTFVGCDSALTIKNNGVYTFPSGADNTKFTTDGNTAVATLAGFDFAFNISGTTVSDSYDPTPSSTLTPVTALPSPNPNQFFSAANYRGAFQPGVKSWMSDWTYAALIDLADGLVPCPNDVNGDGLVGIGDVNAVLGAFGSSCD